jgi:hypothetical protein
MSGIHMVLLGAAGGAVVNPLPISSIGDGVLAPASAAASVGLTANGALTKTGNDSVAGPSWFEPNTAAIGDSYWARLTVNSGTAPSGSASGVWLALSTSRTWNWNRGTNGSTTCNATIQIASNASGSNVVSSATFDAVVVREP